MARKLQPIRSDIAWSNRTRIVVRGKDLPTEVIGTLNLETSPTSSSRERCRRRTSRASSMRSWSPWSSTA